MVSLIKLNNKRLQKYNFLFINYKKQFGKVKNSLYLCTMKKQIQSYLSEEDYSKLKEVANKQGLCFATLVRQIIINYLKTIKNDS